MLRPFARGLILPMLSTWLNATFVIYNILWNPNAGSRTVLMNIDALFLTPQIVTSKPQLKNAFSTFPICYLSQLKHLDMNAFIPGKHARRTSFIKPKLSSLWEVKPRANGPNIVGQQLSTLLDVTCCVRLHTLLHWSVACCCAKFEAGQTFQPTTPNISFVPWSPKRSATMLDPFAQLFQHCWGHAGSLRMDYKDTAGPNIVGSCCIRLHTTANMHATTPNIVGATVLGVVAPVCTHPNKL